MFIKGFDRNLKRRGFKVKRKIKMFIKGFDKNLKCRGMQFEIGKSYEIKGKGAPVLCSHSVFHYCDSLIGVHDHYSAEKCEGNRFCEIIPEGAEVFDMTDAEKKQNSIAKGAGGYLKKQDYKGAFKASYAALSDEERKIQTAMLRKLPNFDAKIFYKISGIKIE